MLDEVPFFLSRKCKNMPDLKLCFVLVLSRNFALVLLFVCFSILLCFGVILTLESEMSTCLSWPNTRCIVTDVRHGKVHKRMPTVITRSNFY